MDIIKKLNRIKKRGPRFKYEHLYPQIRERLENGVSMDKISAEFGISKATVWNVANRLEGNVI